MWKCVKRVMLVFMLLLSSAIAVMWVRSCFAADVFVRQRQTGGKLRVTSLRICQRRMVVRDASYPAGIWVGDDAFSVDWRGPGGGPSFSHQETKWLSGDDPSWRIYCTLNWRKAGFELLHGTEYDSSFTRGDSRNGEYASVGAPFWFLFLLTSLYPVVVGVLYVRRRREGRGFPVGVSESEAGGGGGPQRSGRGRIGRRSTRLCGLGGRVRCGLLVCILLLCVGF